MPNYHRVRKPGGCFFLTVVTERRAPILTTDIARPILHDAIAQTLKERPFILEAMVLLPDHFHLLMRLPSGDSDYALRIAAIKTRFTRDWREAGGEEQPRTARHVHTGERAVWQRRFWEHTIRDKDDFERHFHYIHRNPVKHGFVKCPHAWPYSTFHRWMKKGVYAPDWRCVCSGRPPELDDGFDIDETAME